ncbi:type II secretion system F family protein [Streptomyces sp. RS10V-4]|uniref:type II secretion system F family protein n=1 Tax=Streptomyces rhizoryzae TaxID=2932493 RepID=UPI0020060806|nr:type II secretion system F family protein [Streptomyces rhizoryzae]MCK7624167.1 type II secretion system F family protein [Streptomyces rhizoryzae]
MSPEVVHRVGTAVAVAAAVRYGPELIRPVRARRAVRRRAPGVLADAAGGPYGGEERVRGRARWPGRARRGRPRAGRDGAPRDGRLTEWAGPAAVAGCVAVLLGGVAGVPAGLLVGWAAHRWLRWQRAAAAGRVAAARAAAELAPAGELLAACLAAGAGPRAAAEAVGRSLDGTVAERLRHIAAELRLGGEPAAVWGRLAELPGAGELARCLERAGISGAPAVEPAARIAAGLRADRARAAAAKARRAGVLVTLPLSGCFLPAFLVLGLAPVLIGLAGGLLGGE